MYAVFGVVLFIIKVRLQHQLGMAPSCVSEIMIILILTIATMKWMSIDVFYTYDDNDSDDDNSNAIIFGYISV